MKNINEKNDAEYKPKKKQKSRVTVNFIDEYMGEFNRLKEEKSQSETVCKALREHYERMDMEKSNSQEILEKLDILTHMILDVKKEVSDSKKQK